jgi:hypothetical protein
MPHGALPSSMGWGQSRWGWPWPVVARTANHFWAQYALTAAATLVFCSTKLQPLIVVGIAAVIGWAGFV